MGILDGASSNVLLGTIAGVTIFLGLPIARWKHASDHLRGLLALAAAGVLLFLIIEVGSHAIEIVEGAAKSGVAASTCLKIGILIAGLIAGLIGLAGLEESRTKNKSEGASPIDIATMIAIGIGLHNFAEGLAIGQSFSGGQIALGTVLVVGFALHNATEGFGIAAPLVGQQISWGKLIVLGLIAGLPTTLGAALGGVFVNENVELLFLSLAVGSLIYVTRELLKLRFLSLSTVSAMTALTIGLLVGIGTEIIVEVASAKAPAETSIPVETDRITFDQNGANPRTIEIMSGECLSLVNQTDSALEFEGHQLIAGEAFVPAQSKLIVKVIGTQGQYALSPEGHAASTVTVKVLPGKAAALTDEIQAIAAIITLEGHVRASHDLHMRAINGKSPNSELDLKRAGKHAHHPVHELLEEGKGPRAEMVQKLLSEHELLLPLKEKLALFTALASDKSSNTHSFEKAYKDLLSTIENARQQIGGEAYGTPYLKKQAVLLVLQSAEDEYKEATENGSLDVIEPAVPGKDAYLEYQDVRGFFQACRNFIGDDYESALSSSAKDALSTLLNKEFSSLDPINPKHPTPANEIEELVEQIEKGLS